MMEDDEIPFYSEKKPETDGLANKVMRVATSAVLFITSFILSNLLLNIIIAKISTFLKYTIRFSYNQVAVLPWDYHYWSRTNIVLIFFFSPLICMVLGLIIFNLLRISTTWANAARMFFFWLSICLINMVLSHALIAPLGSPADRNNGLYQTFAVVGAFLWINPALMVLASIGSLITSIGMGMLARKELMRYSFSNKLIKTKKGMDSVVIQVFIVPVIVSALPLVMLSSQASFFTTLMELANLAIISIGIFLMNSIGIAVVRCNKRDVLNHFPAIELVICMTLWLSIYVFLRGH